MGYSRLIHDLPLYQDHVFDRRLWEDIPNSTFDTPVPSGTVTPNGMNSGSMTPFSGESRRNSQNFDEMTSTNSAVQRQRLIDQLEALSLRNGGDTNNVYGSSPDAGVQSRSISPDYSHHAALSANGTAGSTPPTVQENDQLKELLSRVPSYNTAFSAPITPLSGDLPPYRHPCPSDDRHRQVHLMQQRAEQ